MWTLVASAKFGRRCVLRHISFNLTLELVERVKSKDSLINSVNISIFSRVDQSVIGRILSLGQEERTHDIHQKKKKKNRAVAERIPRQRQKGGPLENSQTSVQKD
jgi:hypothetical protein